MKRVVSCAGGEVGLSESGGGYGRRRYKAEYLRFLVFAKASLGEAEEHLRYLQDCHPFQKEEATLLLAAADTLGRKLHHFMQLVEAQHRT